MALEGFSPAPHISALSSSQASNGSQCSALQSSTQDVLQSIVKSRRNWKTLKGGEIIWPPELEAALLGGLEAYRPNDSRETRLLGRFPMRNRFISDYIYQNTGARRTPKQVGSCLQQLRDTYKGEKLVKLLSPCCSSISTRPAPFQFSSRDPSSEASNLLPTPINASTKFYHLSSVPLISTTFITIDILPHNASYSYEPHSESLEWGRSNAILHSSSPRPLHMIDPTVTFVAPSVMPARSFFKVYMAGIVVHSETTHLTAAGLTPNPINGALLYSTTLVPKFWQKILESSDPTQYTITQNVILNAPNPQSIVFSAVYKFNHTPGNRINTSHSFERFEDSELMHNTQASTPMDCLAHPDLQVRESYYDLSSIREQDLGWASRSPSY